MLLSDRKKWSKGTLYEHDQFNQSEMERKRKFCLIHPKLKGYEKETPAEVALEKWH